MLDSLLKETFFTIIDDTHDIDDTFRLLSSAKNKVERVYKPLILQETDETQVRNIGDTYLTMKDLPDDWRATVEMYVGTKRVRRIPYAKKIFFKDAPNRFYIKLRDDQFAITGRASASEVIHHTYIVKTPDLTAATAAAGETTIVWPEEFHELVAYEAAAIYQAGLDSDTTSFRMSAEQKLRHQELLDAFISWDHDQKVEEMDDRGGFDEEDGDLEGDLAQM